ncbi:MAG: molybdopterin-dependent oxidoreductase [Coriobacteriia bacterium]|nr:molybdopterin-dependent oxidoreductase [Coriobacteriia bacterium]
MSKRTVRSNCHYCGYLCGFWATVEETAEGDRLVDLTPDPTRYPYNERITNGCQRWRMNLEQIDAPERVNYPLRRVGERGSGQWERISWEQALDDIASRLGALAAEHGPQTLASAIGGPHASYWPLHRFLNLFGTPNNMGIGQICWNIRIWMDCLTYGWPIEVNIDPSVTGAVFLWGANPAQSDNLLFWRTLLTMDKQKTPLVVIDPRRTKTASIATLHLAPHPGTDATLALALIRQVIATDRIDHAFVQRWCHGFDELVAHVQPYTLEYAEKVCGVPALDIAQAAHIFSEPSPTALLSGRGIDQLGPNSAPTHRALSILRALTGDVDRAGACLIEGRSDFIPEVELEMSASLTPEQRARQLNLGYTALQSYPGYEGASQLTGRFGKALPMRYLTSAHPNLVWRAALSGDPYRVSALICMAANPLVTYADTKLIHEALHALDLLVVLEYYLTPTAQLADYVLPSAGAFERPLIQAHGGVANFCYGGAAAVEPYYERRADYDFFRELGRRLGQEEHWPGATLKDAIERTLAPAGMSWQQWTERGLYAVPAVFNKQEVRGFATTTGKIELANEYLDSIGGGRLPVPAPVQQDPQYPLTLITGARVQPYWASSYFNNPRFRAQHPEPLAQMSNATLEQAGLEEGQWVEVSTARGSARFKAEVAEIKDGVISVEYGWWYPEEEQGEPHLSGAWRSNANLLTSADIAGCEPLIGSWSYNAIPCNLRPSI